MLTEFIDLLLTFLSVAFIFWMLVIAYRKVISVLSYLLNEYRRVEKVLFDIRDGEKQSPHPERRFPRVKVKEGVVAKLMGSDTNGHMKALDISIGGALLRTNIQFQKGETLNLNMYLPLFPQPIDVKARVVRTVNYKTVDGSSVFDAGIEFLDMPPSHKERLIETVNKLLESPANS